MVNVKIVQKLWMKYKGKLAVQCNNTLGRYSPRTASLGIRFVYREYPRPVAIVAYAGFRLAGEGGGEAAGDVRRT